jgi:hypothetical protein
MYSEREREREREKKKCPDKEIPSGNQTWLAGKSTIYRSFSHENPLFFNRRVYACVYIYNICSAMVPQSRKKNRK